MDYLSTYQLTIGCKQKQLKVFDEFLSLSLCLVCDVVYVKCHLCNHICLTSYQIKNISISYIQLNFFAIFDRRLLLLLFLENIIPYHYPYENL